MLNLSGLLADHRPGAGRAPVVEWPAAEAPFRRRMRCPNCGSRTRKTVRLAVRWKTITDPVRRMRLLRCADCDAAFFEHQKPPDYTEPSLMEKGRVPFYLQQGAGVSLITRPLARLNNPPGSTYLDVGCGFGFGLDFAVSARGWVGRGIDPAPLAGLGRAMLGLDIDLRYLTPDDAARAACDVVMSSETIEHVRSPLDFVRTLRWALKPGGVLILTTPDADKLQPSLPAATLVPMLSPGLHLVMQNRASLTALLLQSGFAHVETEDDGCSLVAYASDAPLDLEDDPAILRARYRDYLGLRAASAPAGSDLFLAMAGRALTEAASDGDAPAAERAWNILAPACKLRFGLELDDPALPPAEAAAAPLERMAELMPLNLASILYARVMLRLAQGAPRSDVEAQLHAVGRAARALRTGLQSIAIDDLQTADIEWVARAELLLCAADRGAADIVPTLARLPPAPGETAEGRRAVVAVRVMTALVNGGRYDLARAVADAEGMRSAAWADPGSAAALTPALCDGLFSLAVLDLQPPEDPPTALARMRRVQAAILARPAGAAGAADGLFLAALRGELQAVVALRLGEEAERLRGRIAAFENPSRAAE